MTKARLLWRFETYVSVTSGQAIRQTGWGLISLGHHENAHFSHSGPRRPLCRVHGCPCIHGYPCVRFCHSHAPTAFFADPPGRGCHGLPGSGLDPVEECSPRSANQPVGAVTIAERLANALRADLARRLGLARPLEALDEEVAKAALATFENALGAAYWLIEPAMALGAKAPLEVCQSKAGKDQVLRELNRIDHNLPQ